MSFFFIISKIVGLFLNPLVWISGLLLAALLVKRPRLSKRLSLLAFCFLLFFSNSFISTELIRLWEIRPRMLKPGQNYDVAIVPGGGMVQKDKSRGRLIFRENTDRFLQAVMLYHQKRINKILVSGGSGYTVNRGETEAPLIREYLIQTGIPESDILIDSQSVNTRENALYSRLLLDSSIPGGSYLLITSAIHMRRAAACYRKAGIRADLYPVDQAAGPRHFDLPHMLLPQPYAIKKQTELIHEVFGYATYWLAGYL